MPQPPTADRRPAGACRALCGVALLPRVRAIRSFDHVTPTRVKRESKSFEVAAPAECPDSGGRGLCGRRSDRTDQTHVDMPAICVTVEVRPLHAVQCAAGCDWMWVGCGKSESLFMAWPVASQSGMYAISSARHTKHHAPHPPLALHPVTVRLAPACPFVPNVCAPSPMCLPQYV